MLRRHAALIYLLTLTLISQVILPLVGQRDVYPFFVWDLFSAPEKGPLYDLKIEVAGASILLTSTPHGVFSGSDKIRLWHLIHQPLAEDRHSLVNGILAARGFKPVGICKINISLPKYLLLKEKDTELECSPF